MIFLTVMVLLGQTTAVFDYEFAVGLSLQEDVGLIGPHAVQFNRAFGAADTVVYVPLLAAAIIGLLRRRRWAYGLAAAVMGISLYWPAACAFMMLFMEGQPGYRFPLSPSYLAIFGAVMLFAAWGLYACCKAMAAGDRSDAA
jgi:hypothetical protein